MTFLKFSAFTKMGLLSPSVSKKTCMDIKVCLKINSSLKIHLLGVIFLTTKLTIFAVHVNYLHISKQPFLFYCTVNWWN